jgi:hypothetical protein
MRAPSIRPPSRPAAAAPPATSGDFALLAVEPTVAATSWTTPLLRFEDRPFFDAVEREELVLREPPLFARPFELAVERLERVRLDAAAERLALVRFEVVDLPLLPFDVVLLRLAGALDERDLESAMEASLSGVVQVITQVAGGASTASREQRRPFVRDRTVPVRPSRPCKPISPRRRAA